MKTVVAPVVAAALAVLAAGCGARQVADVDSSGLEGVPWLMTAGIDVEGWKETVPSVRLEAGKLDGFTGCNSFGAPYVVDGSTLQVRSRQGIMTLIGCQSPARDVELAYLDSLERVASWRVEGDELVLLDDENDELLRFVSATPVGPWTGLDWIDEPLPGTRPTATLTEGGKISGFAGCNTYGASYTYDRGAIEISDLFATEMLCKAPAGVMEQEHEFLETLRTVTGYRVHNEVLRPSRADGKQVAFFARATR